MPSNRTALASLVAGGAILFALFTAAVFLSGGETPPPAAAATPAPEAPATVMVGESDYGPMLFDGRGYALYAFTRDGRGPSVCAAACAEAWPPYLLDGELVAGDGTRQNLLGTVRSPDGSRQVTYDGRPLYYYVGDREPGLVLCQDVVEFGGTWLVVRGDGVLVR